MSRALGRWLLVAAVFGPVATLSAGCVGPGGSAGEPPGMDFYEPNGADYGAFDSGLQVGPFNQFNDFGGGRGRFGGFGGRGTGFR